MGELHSYEAQPSTGRDNSSLCSRSGICTPVFVHRHDFDVALSRWMKDQSIENTIVLKAEARKSRWIALKAQIVAGCVAFLLLNGVWFMVRRVTHSGASPAPKAGQVKWRFGRSRWRDGRYRVLVGGLFSRLRDSRFER